MQKSDGSIITLQFKFSQKEQILDDINEQIQINALIKLNKNQQVQRQRKMAKKYGKRRQTLDLHETELYDKVTKLQSSILSQLQYLNKKRNYKFDCLHCCQEFPAQYDPKRNYYDEFWKSYLINAVCIKRYQDYNSWIKKIDKKINKVQTTYIQHRRAMQPIQLKRRKKLIKQAADKFQCLQCGKNYKDQDSLNIHKTIKHSRQELKFQAATYNLLQAKIQELDHPYIENSNSEGNFCSQKQNDQ